MFDRYVPYMVLRCMTDKQLSARFFESETGATLVRSIGLKNLPYNMRRPVGSHATSGVALKKSGEEDI